MSSTLSPSTSDAGTPAATVLNVILSTATILANSTTPAAEETFPTAWLWAKPFYDWVMVRENFATYIIGPMMLFVYGGAGIAYVVGHQISYWNFQFKIKKNERLGLPPPKKKKKKKQLTFLERMQLRKKEEDEKLMREQMKAREVVIRKLKKKARNLRANRAKTMDDEERKNVLSKYYESILLPDDYRERRNSWSGPIERSIRVDTAALREPIKRKPPRQRKIRKTPTPPPLTEEEILLLERRTKKMRKRVKREFKRRKDLGLPEPTIEELVAMGLDIDEVPVFTDKQLQQQEPEEKVQNVVHAIAAITSMTKAPLNVPIRQSISPMPLRNSKRVVRDNTFTEEKRKFLDIADIWRDKPEHERNKEQKMKNLKEKARLLRMKRQSRVGSSHEMPPLSTKQVTFSEDNVVTAVSGKNVPSTQL